MDRDARVVAGIVIENNAGPRSRLLRHPPTQHRYSRLTYQLHSLAWTPLGTECSSSHRVSIVSTSSSSSSNSFISRGRVSLYHHVTPLGRFESAVPSVFNQAEQNRRIRTGSSVVFKRALLCSASENVPLQQRGSRRRI